MIFPNLAGLIAAAKKHEGKFFAFLSGDWRRAKRAVRTHYKGKSSSVAMALLQLAEMQRTAANRDRARADMEKDCGFQGHARDPVLRWSAPGRRVRN